ncbi:MAG: histidine kinase dimerization/phosphoacceptor domain -containing protein [Spirochaetota bacterium]|nr:histidine kinase dimerization/phosphoacceptor domain -containing protein [Spirochaetota bacterium]
MKRNRSIRGVLFFHFSSATLIPLFILLVTLGLLLNHNIRRSTIDTNRVIASSITREVNTFLSHVDSIGRLMLPHLQIHMNNMEEIQVLLSNLRDSFSFFEAAVVLDSDGVVLASSPMDADIIGNHLSTQPVFRLAAANRGVQWSDTFISPYTNSPTVAVIFPGMDMYLLGYINLDHLSTIGAQITTGGSPQLIIVDEKGTLLVHPDTRLVLQQYNVFQNLLVKQTLGGKTGTYDASFEGQSVLGSTALVRSTNWGVLILQDKDEVFAILYRVLFSVGLLIFLAAILSTVLALFSREQIVRPIYQLMKTTRAIADGRYEQPRDAVESYREINYLAGTITQMSNKIARREEELKKNLMEKEILIKEVHHRVKNNLQLILSILNLKNFSIEDEQIKDVLYDNIGRIYTIAQVHEQLYSSDDLSSIDISSYIPSLTSYLLANKKYSAYDVHPRIQVDKVCVRVDQAIPLGLIVFELFSNALQHGFGHRKTKAIEITGAVQEERLLLTVQDDGETFSPELFTDAESLGFNIVHELIQQVKGSISYDSDHGNTFTLEFNVS